MMTFDNTLGALFIGLTIAAILCGITNAQSFWFFRSSRKNPIYLKWMVGCLWILDMLHMILISHACYTDLVTKFNTTGATETRSWSLTLEFYVTGFSDFIVRLIYTHRIWIMSKQNWMLAIVSTVLSLASTLSAFSIATKSFSFYSMSSFKAINWLLYLGAISTVVADLWNAGILCWYLSKRRTSFDSTESIINTLMLYTINTGLLTALCAIGVLISFAALPNDYVFLSFYFCLPKLYLNGLLASLNARDQFRKPVSDTEDSIDAGYQLSRIGIHSSGSKAAPTHLVNGQGLVINVQTSTVSDLQCEEAKSDRLLNM